MSVSLRWKKTGKGQRAYLDIYPGKNKGKRKAKFLDIVLLPTDSVIDKDEKKRQAEAYRAKLQLELLSSDTGILPEHRKQVELLLFMDSVVREYKRRDVRKLHGLKQHLKLFMEDEKLQLRSVDEKFCSDFLDFLIHHSDLSRETAHNYWTKFKYVLSRAKQLNLISDNKASSIKFKRSDKERFKLVKQILTKDELKVLTETYCGNQEVKDAFLFACLTGLGAAEIRDLKRENIDNGTLKIKRKKNGEIIENLLPKMALEIVNNRIDIEPIFKLPSDTAINKLLSNWVKKAKIEKHITFYCARHTFAVLLLKTGSNLKTVAEAMGHSSTQHTIKYLKYIDDLKEEALKKLDAVAF